jgi:WD40 repeat protein
MGRATKDDDDDLSAVGSSEGSGKVRSDDIQTLVSGDVPEAEQPSTVKVALTGHRSRDPYPNVQVVDEAPGRYSILSPQGRGGQAWVYRVFDTYLCREVAMKLPLDASCGDSSSGPSEGSDAYERFLREIRITGQLTHPSIVHVYEAGRRDDGTPYYTMQFVQGTTLARALGDANDHEGRLAYLGRFVDLCHGIAYAHSRGILHRDIKPSNVMLGEFGETILLDWGIATLAGVSDQEGTREASDGAVGSMGTQNGALLGTPRYMSPEQARGRMQEVDQRSDIWALGAVLYEILTGQPPFLGATATEVLNKARSATIRPVREICSKAPPELAAIAEKALQPDKQQRYESAKQLADDVVAYMTGRRVSAHDYGAWELTRLVASRNKAAFAAATIVLATLVVSLVLVGSSYHNEREAAFREKQARAQEHQARLEAQFRLGEAFAMRARQHARDRNLLASRVYAAASLKNNPAHPRSPVFESAFADSHPESRRLLVDALSDLFEGESRILRGLVDVVPVDHALVRLAASPDGTHMAGVDPDRGLQLWSLPSKQRNLAAPVEGEKPVCVAFSPCGKRVATGSHGGLVVVRSVPDGAVIRSFPGHGDSIRAIAFSPSGKRLATGGRDTNVRLWDSSSWNAAALLPVGHQVADLTFRGDDTLAMAVRDGSVQLWDANTGKKVGGLLGHQLPVEALAISPDGRTLVSGSQDKTAKIWSLPDGALKATLELHGEAVVRATFSPDGEWLMTVARDRLVRLWRMADLSLASVLHGHRLDTNDAVFLPDGSALATCGTDGEVRRWALDLGGPPRAFSGHRGVIFSVSFSPDGRWLASGGADGTARVWDASTAKPKLVLRGHEQAVLRVAFSPDGSRLVSSSRDRTVREWRLEDGQQVRFFEEPSPVYALALSPDGKTTATGGADGQILLRAAEDLGAARVLQGHKGPVYALAFAPDGQILASSGADGSVRRWDVRTGQLVAAHARHEGWVTGLAFSSDGAVFGTGSKDGLAILWDAGTGKVVREIREHRQWVNALAFSQDGRMMATSSDDRTTILWSRASWEPLLVLWSEGGASAVDFSPDGKLLAVGSVDTIRRWRLDLSSLEVDPTELLVDAQRLAGAELEGFRLEMRER